MAQYNLTDNVKPDFDFKIGELVFRFRYPTTPELREISTSNNELQVMIEEKADESDIEKKSKETEALMNALITPVEHDSQISEVLEAQPINVIRNFRQMMAKEINLG